MTTQPVNANNEVTEFLDNQKHPLRQAIEQLRHCILLANPGLTENIKWNGPNYCFNNEDRIAMKIQPPKQIQLIFHRGAKKLEQPKSKIINVENDLLVWKENDRAIATFRNIHEIDTRQTDLTQIVIEWINATK